MGAEATRAPFSTKAARLCGSLETDVLEFRGSDIWLERRLELLEPLELRGVGRAVKMASRFFAVRPSDRWRLAVACYSQRL